MLLPRWLETLRHHADRPAIFSGAGVLRFSDLANALARLPRADAPVLAHGSPFDVCLATLRAWRDGQPLVPVEKPDRPLPDLDALPPGVAHVKATPGNEGRPRGVWFTGEQLAADADRLVAAMSLEAGVPNLAAISPGHSYGFSSLILPLLLHGVPLHVIEVPFPAVVDEAFKSHDRLVVPAVPSMWRAWHRSGILRDAPIALAVSAGAPLPAALEQSIWNDHALKLHNFYGTSEAGGISYDATDLPRQHPDDLGTPLPGVEVGLDPDGRFLVRSSAVALGYDALRPGEILGGGRFLTPDHGHLEDGRLLLDSRGRQTINVAGRKLGPARIEAALRQTGLIDRVRVFGIPSSDPDRVDDIAALIPPGTVVADLRRAASETLAGWEIPRRWVTAEPGDWDLDRAALRERCNANP